MENPMGYGYRWSIPQALCLIYNSGEVTEESKKQLKDAIDMVNWLWDFMEKIDDWGDDEWFVKACRNNMFKTVRKYYYKKDMEEIENEN